MDSAGMLGGVDGTIKGKSKVRKGKGNGKSEYSKMIEEMVNRFIVINVTTW